MPPAKYGDASVWGLGSLTIGATRVSFSLSPPVEFDDFVFSSCYSQTQRDRTSSFFQRKLRAVWKEHGTSNKWHTHMAGERRTFQIVFCLLWTVLYFSPFLSDYIACAGPEIREDKLARGGSLSELATGT